MLTLLQAAASGEISRQGQLVLHLRRKLSVELTKAQVSSLVARWQTAADIEQQQAARRESGSRRSSINSLGRRSSDTFSAKPSPRVEGGEALLKVDNGDGEVVEMLDDFEAKVRVSEQSEETKKTEVDSESEIRAGGEGEGKDGDGDVKVEGEPDSKGEGNGVGPTNGETISGTAQSAEAKHEAGGAGSKDKSEEAKAGSSARVTASVKKPSAGASSRLPSSTVRPAPTARKTSASSTRPSVTSTSAKTNGIAKSAAPPISARPASVTATTKTGPAPSAKASSSTSSVRKPTTTVKAPSQSSARPVPSSSISSKPVTTVPQSRAKTGSTTRPPPSSFSTSASRVRLPTTTQNGATAVKRPSPAVPPETSKPPAPLRPQVTGTPAKPTASSLAKAREAAEKRQSLSLGRAAGTAPKQRLSTAPQTTGHGKTASAPSAPAPSSSKPAASGSRLLQGTASTRAKAAEPQSPRSPKTATAPRESLTARVNLAQKDTLTPTRQSGAKQGQSPASPSVPKTPVTPRSPVASKRNEGDSGLRAPQSPTVTKARDSPRSPTTRTAKENDAIPKSPSSSKKLVSVTPARIDANGKDPKSAANAAQSSPLSARKSASSQSPISNKATTTAQSPSVPKSDPAPRPLEESKSTIPPLQEESGEHHSVKIVDETSTAERAELQAPVDAEAAGDLSIPIPQPQPNSGPGNNETAGGASSTDGQAAVAPPIGRLGLAAAREAPKADEDAQSVPTPAPAPAPARTELPAEQHDDKPFAITKETEQVTPTKPNSAVDDLLPESSSDAPIDHVDSLEEVKQAGEVEEPEIARSAPDSGPNANDRPANEATPSGPFGRIGHPGAKGGREMESPNPVHLSASSAAVGIKWNEDELKRDPAKTIVSPDVNKKSEESDSA